MCGRSHRILGAPLARSEQRGLVAASLTPSVSAAEVATHGHTEAHFVCVTRGRYRSQIAGDTEGTLLLFHPVAVEHRDCFHETQQLSDAHFFALTLGGESALWCETLRIPLWSSHFPQAIAHQSAFVLQTCLDSLDDAAPADVQLDLQQLVAELLGLLVQGTLGYERATPTWFARAREALFDLEDGDATLGTLAALANVHPVYFARAFRRIAGCSPGEYRRRHQMNRALALLRSTRRTLSEIAQESGFYDHAHFTRQFRARFGVTPSVFRAQVANVQDHSQAHLQN
jgi:AraC family transcriptional regulator